MKPSAYYAVLLTTTLLSITGCARNAPQPLAEKEGNGEVIRPIATEPVESEGILEGLLEAIANAYGDDYLPNMVMDEEMLLREFPIDRSFVEEMRGTASKISVHPDRVVVVRAVEGKGEEVERQLWDVHAKMLEDPLQYEVNGPKIRAAQVVRMGDFVCFLLVGTYSGDSNATEEELQEHFKNEVSIGVRAFEDFFVK